MAASILPFPSPAGACSGSAAPPRGRPAPRRRYDFAQLCAFLALDRLDQRTQVDHLRKLAHQRGLPLPLNPRLRCQHIVAGPASIGRRSIWCALEIDAWLDGQRTPPGAAMAQSLRSVAAGPAAIRPDQRHDMLQRARQLGAG